MNMHPSFFREDYPHNLNINTLFEQAFKRDNAARLTLISEFTPLEIIQSAYQEYCEFGNGDRIDFGFNLARECEEYHENNNQDYIKQLESIILKIAESNEQYILEKPGVKEIYKSILKKMDIK